MTPTYVASVRHPGLVTLAMLQDMRWFLADGAPNVTQSGPIAVSIGHDVPFEANLVWPEYTNELMTYAWSATDQEVITHTGRGITDSVTLGWTTPSLKTVAVTATGADVPASATRSVLTFGVVLTGLAQGDVGRAYTFDASLAPKTTALTITYYWEASDQAAVTHPDKGTTDAVAFTWTTTGTQTITVTATIGGESAQAIHTIQIEGTSLDYHVYLPFVRK